MASEKWDNRFMRLAKHVSTWSKDTSTKVGAVAVNSRRIVLSMGYNGLPRFVDDDVEARRMRPEKYFWFEHAERNCIYNTDSSLMGARLYCTLFPCADCARGVIQVGISEVICPPPDLERWADSHKAAQQMLTEAQVRVRHVNDK